MRHSNVTTIYYDGDFNYFEAKCKYLKSIYDFILKFISIYHNLWCVCLYIIWLPLIVMEREKSGECLLLIDYTFTSESGLYTHSPLSTNQNTLFKMHQVLIGRLL